LGLLALQLTPEGQLIAARQNRVGRSLTESLCEFHAAGFGRRLVHSKMKDDQGETGWLRDHVSKSVDREICAFRKRIN